VFNACAKAAELPPVERFNAVDKDFLDIGLYLRQGALTCHGAELWKKKQDKLGDLACMLSHLLLWKRIAGEPGPGIHVIFEDDADIQRDFLGKLRECLPTLPSDFDYAYLGHNRLRQTRVGIYRGF
jgi:GR25 family glycosyltransferase involved in LPS biosynthesis